MKKVSLLLVAFALVMGLSQCRKPNLPVINPGETQHVVLNASWDNGGSKLEQEGAGLKWKQGDKLTVSGCATGDLYCSSPDDGVFEGEITKGSGEKIKFTFGEQNFTEQTGLLDDAVSLTSGELDYKADGKYGKVSMTMPHAVMKLDLSALGTADGTTVTINELGGGTVASVKGVKNDEASKALYVAVEAPNAFGTPEESLVSRKYEFESSVGVASCDGWKLKNNTFYTFTGETGAAIVVTPTSNPKLLSGKFSISATEYVQFSRGNLFCTRDTESGPFHFAFEKNQFDFRNHPNKASMLNGVYSASSGTPANTSGAFQWDVNAAVPGKDYGAFGEDNPGTPAADATIDWGQAIGGNWYTMTKLEMKYVVGIGTPDEKRPNYEYLRKISKIVFSGFEVNGLVLAPDNYDFESNPLDDSYTESEWAQAEKEYGLVFFPCAGFNNEAWAAGGVGRYYVSDNPGSHLYFIDSGDIYMGSSEGEYHCKSVRLVQKFCKLEFVDLGLASGTLWCKTNLYASSATDYGFYYQFGSTTGHDNSQAAAYSTWPTAPFNGGYSSWNETVWNVQKALAIGSDGNLKQEYDVAYQQTNGVARIPTRSQFEELTALTNEWTSNYDNTGVPGRVFHGTNGNILFIPAAGCYYDGNANYVGQNGVLVWSRTVSGEDKACYMYSWDNSVSGLDAKPRYYSYPIRPVKASGE